MYNYILSTLQKDMRHLVGVIGELDNHNPKKWELRLVLRKFQIEYDNYKEHLSQKKAI